MMTRKKFQEMRRGNIEEYAEFMVELSSSVVSDVIWRNSILIDCDKRMKYCKRVTPSDEAFILFVVLNSWVKWTRPQNENQDIGVDDINDDDNLVLDEWNEKRHIFATKYGEQSDKYQKIMMPNLYSGDKRRKGSGVQGKNGWSTEGIKKYNDLFNQVKQDRKEQGDAFDEVVDDLIEKHFRERKSAKRVKRSFGVVDTEAAADPEAILEWSDNENA
jgi:hypothetical protein